jgi:hypothetical protein
VPISGLIGLKSIASNWGKRRARWDTFWPKADGLSARNLRVRGRDALAPSQDLLRSFGSTVLDELAFFGQRRECFTGLAGAFECPCPDLG